jgi:hypothetical protein
MVTKVARLHFQHASPSGALRALSGWLIAITGLALLVARFARSIEGFEPALSGAVAGGAMAAAATALGALPLLVVRKIGAGAQGRNRSLSGVLFPPAPTRNNASHVHEGGTRSDQGDSDQQQVAAA